MRCEVKKRDIFYPTSFLFFVSLQNTCSQFQFLFLFVYITSKIMALEYFLYTFILGPYCCWFCYFSCIFFIAYNKSVIEFRIFFFMLNKGTEIRYEWKFASIAEFFESQPKNISSGQSVLDIHVVGHLHFADLFHVVAVVI